MIIYTRHTRIPPPPLPHPVFGLSDTDNRSVPQRARTLTRGGDSGGGGGDCSGRHTSPNVDYIHVSYNECTAKFYLTI